MPSLIGRVLDGKVRIVSVLGEGGMGAVYRGVQLHFDRDVAVKILKAQFSNSEDLVRRFYREAKAAGQLRSRHVVAIYDYGRSQEGAYIIMELSNGVSLAELLDKEGRLSAERSVMIAAQILSGLAEAHSKGIVHRDLKTDNILIEKDYSEKDFALLLDFGIARLEGSMSVQTAAGSIFGTPSYMAPEQCRGDVADPRTDLYSVGIILYEMLAGTTPFGNRQPSQLLFAHLKETPPHVKHARPDIRPELGALVMKMIAKAREDRPQTADVARRELLATLTSAPSVELLQSFEETIPEDAEASLRAAEVRVMSLPADETGDNTHRERPSTDPAGGAQDFEGESTLPPDSGMFAPKEAVDVVTRVLTETLGPVASLLVNKELARMVTVKERLRSDQVHSLIERVCLRIKDADKRENFARDVRKALEEI